MSSGPRPEVDLEASCACGAVRIGVRGTIYSMFLCACEDCQKATGTGHATVAIMNTASVTVSGTTRCVDRPAASGAVFTRCFCPDCGTPLFGKSSRAPQSVMLPVGLFGRQAQWYVPNQLIFARSHHRWDQIDEALPRHETYRDQPGS
jgi:hypothetical protein